MIFHNDVLSLAHCYYGNFHQKISLCGTINQLLHFLQQLNKAQYKVVGAKSASTTFLSHRGYT